MSAPQIVAQAPGPSDARADVETSLLVVIVNYRTPEMSIACLASLAEEIRSIPGACVVVVDNGSGDGSASAIATAIDRARWEDWATVLPLERNGGFAYGNNRGLEADPRARYYLLLNSDTLVQPGALRYCLGVMERDRAIGAMSCMLLNDDGTVQNVTRRFPSPLRRALGVLNLPWKLPRLFGWADIDDLRWDRRTMHRDVDWIGGAFLFLRGDMVRRIGGLDEDFFFYGEDIEFCHRIWQAGFRCHYAPGAATIHHGASSSDPTRLAPADRVAHAWRGRHLVHVKLYGRVSAAAALLFDRFVYWLKLVYLRARGRVGGQEHASVCRVLEVLANRELLARPSAAAGEEHR